MIAEILHHLNSYKFLKHMKSYVILTYEESITANYKWNGVDKRLTNMRVSIKMKDFQALSKFH